MLECFELGARKIRLVKAQCRGRLDEARRPDLGWGMAGAAGSRRRFPAEASVQLRDDGTARVACGTQDIGTGTYTILAQLVSDKTGVPLDKIEVVLGDTSLPPGPISGGSIGHRLDGPGRLRRGRQRDRFTVERRHNTPGSPFENRKPDDLAFEAGRVFVKADGPATACRSLICFDAPTCAWSPAAANPKEHSTIKKPKVLDALVRLSLCRSHMAA